MDKVKSSDKLRAEEANKPSSGATVADVVPAAAKGLDANIMYG
jgi:hypothetical protein